jgi:tetratricopeptide (TPR) repeat protein
MAGDHDRSARLFASLAQLQPGQVELARKALAAAMGAGNMELALSLTKALPAQKLSTDARLLLVADAVKRGQPQNAISWLSLKAENGDLTFLTPLVTAWAAAEAGDLTKALQDVQSIPANSLLAPLQAEQTALLMLKFRRTAEAEAYARRAIGAAGPRENRLRLAFADGFVAAGARARAQIMLDGMGSDAPIARQRLLSGKTIGQAINRPAEALGEALTAFSADLARLQRGSAPIGLTQVARYTDPRNSSTTLLLALLLENQDRSDEALEVARSVPRDDALISQARDVQVRILTGNKRFAEAYAIAAPAASAKGAGRNDWSRLGEVFQAMKRNPEAAQAYGRAIALARAEGAQSDLWTLLLLRASALEDSGHWPEAREALQQGLTLAPEQPLLLNFLGYGKLERGEDIDAAEGMIRKASELSPDDASIIDSLGWAQFKRGKIGDAIATLQRAAAKDPEQAEIQEHLGDALYTLGRRFEARFAWGAALVTAEDDVAARVRAKLDAGLTPANAAP